MGFAFLMLLFVLGACFGSFLCCQARRLRARQNSAARRQTLPNRSVCFSCGCQLKWYDNIPIISWLILKGKCRQCHKGIGLAEFLSELLLALVWLFLGFKFILPAFPNFDFTVATNFAQISGFDWALFVITIILTLPLAFLAIYDGLYGELPTLALVFAIIVALVLAVTRGINAATLLTESGAPLTFQFVYANIISGPLYAAMILSGIYLLLYLISRGNWVGDGDWLLCLALGLALGSPWLALVLLFISNALACLVSLPFVIKSKKQSPKIPFGPFLVIGFIIVLLFSSPLLALL